LIVLELDEKIDWARIIADLPDERRLPCEIKKLFMAIDLVINPVCEVKDEG